MRTFLILMRAENKRYILKPSPALAMVEDDGDWPVYKLAKQMDTLLEASKSESGKWDIYAGNGVAGNISYFDFTKPTTEKIIEEIAHTFSSYGGFCDLTKDTIEDCIADGFWLEGNEA